MNQLQLITPYMTKECVKIRVIKGHQKTNSNKSTGLKVESMHTESESLITGGRRKRSTNRKGENNMRN